MRFRRQLNTRTNVELIPLIDVVFQLVVFFMVTTTFIITPGISLVLPTSETAEPVAMENLVVTVRSRDEVYLNKKLYTLDGLDKELRSMGRGERAGVRTVVVEGDEGVSYQLMVDVLDVLRRNGFHGVNLRTKEKE